MSRSLAPTAITSKNCSEVRVYWYRDYWRVGYAGMIVFLGKDRAKAVAEGRAFAKRWQAPLRIYRKGEDPWS